MSAMRIRTVPQLPYNAMRRVGDDPVRAAFTELDRPIRFTRPVMSKAKNQRLGRMAGYTRMAQAFAKKVK